MVFSPFSSSMGWLGVWAAGDGWFLPAPVGLAFDDEFVSGGGEPVHGGMGQQWVGHHGQSFLGGPVRGDHGGGPLVAFDTDLRLTE